MSQSNEPLATGLSVRGAGKKYGPVTVLEGVDLEVGPGEVVALLGENGAGKSTISSIIAGLVQPTAGTMTWNGQPYAPANPRDALARGIGLIHQEMRLLPDLSIAENVFVGRQPTTMGRIDRASMEKRAAEQLHRLGLHVRTSTLVRNLRIAAQQQVEIAKALTLDARLLILDEPTAALGGEETDHLFEQVERLKKEGMGFIYISHRLDEIARIADRVVVLRDGRLVGTYATAQVPVKTLVEAMVGRSVERMFPAIAAATSREVLRVEGLSALDKSFSDVSFNVHAGEVFGIAGIVGAGRTELVRAIAGADPIAAGSIIIDGKPLAPRSPADSLAAGIVLVPEDRKDQGLILEHTIGDNIALGNYPRVAPSGFVTPSAVRRYANENIKRFGVKGSPAQPVNHLSGGNQQKVVLAKCISRQPKVVILDEPTRGIDVGARAQIYDVIAGLAKQGLAVIVVSSDLDEVLGLANRVMVLSRGLNRGILDHDQANRVSVMERATL
ncbi:sugar ABC transporter [Labrys miyagiensis]|uniref:Sugar ABC transporter n=1 Tax=Labrys miyagiensis TaxID=346912 RepID=A0ABQ6CN10_9HYPH|nr:sugar ABC transporter ATP-binding protein [Labrys miyagiensis]GLS21752.1 sugar ABC transporter [Labrys miyagiensis]